MKKHGTEKKESSEWICDDEAREEGRSKSGNQIENKIPIAKKNPTFAF